jgi:dimethylhistidine N-methyltransferase
LLSSSLRDDVIAGLRATPKRLDCKYLYDERGARLFEEICATDAYYLARTEVGILERDGAEIAEGIGEGCCLVEFGSGSGVKTRLLLGQLRRPRAYVPIDINPGVLAESAARLRCEFPELDVRPLAVDYTRDFARPLAATLNEQGPVTVFFPGSTIGNFTRDEARGFLARMADLVGAGGGMVVGVDAKKDPALIHRAYNDPAGITAAFNLNLLARINRELGADFDLDGFCHHAFYHPEKGRVESYLVSLAEQVVTVGTARFEFGRGESIHTEYSYKYSVEEFGALAREAGFETRRVWTDAQGWFGVHHLIAE